MSGCLPNYDAWKLATPPEYEMTTEQERAQEEDREIQEQNLRDAIACVLADNRGDIYLMDVRRIVVEELNKVPRLTWEPEWQTRTPVVVPE
jgi:hypothetical protein